MANIYYESRLELYVANDWERAKEHMEDTAQGAFGLIAYAETVPAHNWNKIDTLEKFQLSNMQWWAQSLVNLWRYHNIDPWLWGIREEASRIAELIEVNNEVF